MKYLVGISVAILIILSVFGILWSAKEGFGQRQSVEFFPYDDEVTLDDGRVIRSSGVVIRVDYYESARSDQEMANLMVAARRMYPEECSGDNYEIAVRRPGPGGAEEKYSYSFSVYDAIGTLEYPDNQGIQRGRIEYGRWIEDQYTVIESYGADWDEIDKIARGQASFQVAIDSRNGE